MARGAQKQLLVSALKQYAYASRQARLIHLDAE